MSAEVPAVLGSYVIERELGRGGMGAVYIGVHQVLGRRAAIKVLLPALSQRDDLVQRFFTEARAITAIQHASIVDVYDFGTAADGSAYIVMEYLEGESLAARLRTRGRLPIPQALAIARQIATGLAAAHAVGVIHRDLKPDNIFLVPDPEVIGGERAKLLDFGVAKLVAADSTSVKTMTGMLLGTPQYMSPEQCEGAREVDHRSDLYSLGCTLFQMVCGRLPFVSAGIGGVIGMHLHMPPPKLRTYAPHASAALEAIVDRLLAKDPQDRPATATEVAAALANPEAAVVSAAEEVATLPAIDGTEATLATRVSSQGGAKPEPEPTPRDAGGGNPATLERVALSPDAAPAVAPRHGGRWLASAVAIVGIAAVTVIAMAVLRDDPAPQPSLATVADGGGDAVTTVPIVRTVPTVPA
ncbi:MAG: serine/threonine protein kinase, partial [Deltaproteobacteria bacterium]|nr:serine/threonine protein kinase [Deltaproteobacteria bacterium]